MHINQLIFIFVFLCALINKGVVSASTCENSSTHEYLGTYYLKAGYEAGRFIALDESYGKLKLFVMPDRPLDSCHYFWNANGYKLENRNWAASSGIGMRAWNESRETACGVNLFYDFRQAKAGSFQQAGLGFEVLSRCWEFHINGYLPFCQKQHLAAESIYNDFTDGFFAVSRDYQYALRGVEMTGGGHLYFSDFDFYFAPGLYFYNNSNYGDIQGCQANAEVSWNEYLTFRVNASYDNHFKGCVQGVIEFNIPSDFACTRNVCNSCANKILGQPVRRNEMVFLRKHRSWKKNWDDCGQI